MFIYVYTHTHIHLYICTCSRGVRSRPAPRDGAPQRGAL